MRPLLALIRLLLALALLVGLLVLALPVFLLGVYAGFTLDCFYTGLSGYQAFRKELSRRS